ncbi:MAG: extracellular solute-binding protein family 1 [Devosia sp.]|uniref:ABC transporter substrate-binding protein n=1 Tax=Devosia sp. TaxID=1871048 RepID=UPI00263416F1|nr:extracellular solute-binding protein [Devosia sp.]MDB5527355.1 extracellular solute-binding protein family 1 [Devosia sp.]
MPKWTSGTATRRAVLKGAVALTVLSLAAGQALAQDVPAGYPADYSAIIEGSRAESALTIFSNVGEVNWRPVLEAFKAKYPWINVQTLDLGASEVFERHYADAASGANTADILLSSSAPNWLELSDKGMVEPYVTLEAANVPDWSRPLDGVYSISVDPFVIAYNKLLLTPDQYPKSLSDIAAAAAKDPASYDKRMGSYGPNTTGFAQAMYNAYAEHGGQKALDTFKTIGPMTELYRSVGPVLEKITTGEYMAGYFISGISLFPLLQDPTRASVIGWTFDADGAAMGERNFAIVKSAQHPNAARLFTDFLLSRDGQQAVGIGGLVPFRSDVDADAFTSKLNYDRVVQQVGADNIVLIRPDRAVMEKLPEFNALSAKLFNEQP